MCSVIKGRDGRFYYTDEDKENPMGESGGTAVGSPSVV